LKTNNVDLIFDTEKVFNYVNDKKPELIKTAVQKLISNPFLVYKNANLLSYIVKNQPELVKSLPNKLEAMGKIKKDDTLKLLELMPLPIPVVEFAYIQRNNEADAKFPARGKLSPETLSYIDIITGKRKDFNNLAPCVKTALINCHFYDQAEWYKIMEQMLIANPDLETKYIQQMLNRDKKTETLIKRHWKGGLRKMRIKNFLSEKKQGVMKFFGAKQKQH